jgi:hypothetical protein
MSLLASSAGVEMNLMRALSVALSLSSLLSLACHDWKAKWTTFILMRGASGPLRDVIQARHQ